MRRRSFLAVTAGLVLALGLQTSAGAPAVPGLVGVFRWQGDDPRFGGFSGIEMTGDGAAFVALSDRAAWVRGQVTRDKTGAITSIETTKPVLLRGRDTARLAPGRIDSEGLAQAGDGSFYLSFEGVARVLHYDTIDGSAENLPIPPEFPRLQINSALEALAVDAAGTLYTLPERTGDPARQFPVYRFKDGEWSVPFSLSRGGTFLPVGADFGPDGRLYVLERQFRGLLGFGSRVRALTLNAAGDAVLADRIVLETPVGLHDNLEGISVWRDAAGHLRLTMVSDDNFSILQRTEIVEYRIPG